MKRKPIWLRNLLIRRAIVALLILFQIAFIVATIFHYQFLRWVRRATTAISVLICFHLMTRRDLKNSIKLSLVFLILLFPLFGGALYCILQYQTGNNGFRNRLAKIERAVKPEYHPSDETLEEAMEALPEYRKPIYYLQKTPKFPIYKNTETQYFADGNDMLASILDELEKAKHYIFIEFFIIEEGVFWDPILEILERKAKDGVDVRVIYDDIGCLLRLPKNYAKRLEKKGIKCRVFNPFRPLLTSVQNNRDHRKIIVVDGTVAYTGGINLADEYLNKKVLFGEWKDNAILLRGDAAWSFTVMFLQMWSFLTKEPESVACYTPPALFQSTETGWVQPYCDSPMDREHVSEHVYLSIIEQARHYLYITTPYLTIDGTVLSALKLCAKSGVDIRIITPHTPDKKYVHFTSRSYYRELIRAGIKIYEYQNGFIHSKCFLADDRIATVGTVNLDFRSLFLHFECGTCLYETDSILSIKEDFDNTFTHCKQITEEDCKHNFIVRLFQDIARIFAPIM